MFPPAATSTAVVTAVLNMVTCYAQAEGDSACGVISVKHQNLP